MAEYEQYQIVEIPSEVVQIGKSDYARPFVIYEIAGINMYTMFISTKIDTFYNENSDFLLNTEEDGFNTTGLTDPGFVRNQDFIVSTSLNLRVIGNMSGDLLARFEDFLSRNGLR